METLWELIRFRNLLIYKYLSSVTWSQNICRLYKRFIKLTHQLLSHDRRHLFSRLRSSSNDDLESIELKTTKSASSLNFLPASWYWHSRAPNAWPFPRATTASGDSIQSFFCFGDKPEIRLQSAAGEKLNKPLKKHQKNVIKIWIN